MEGGTVLNVGFDDTDSPSGMCTTFLAYKVAGRLQGRGDEFLDFPRLVRLNPNVPWKTRGNGAVSMRVRTRDPEGAKQEIRRMVARYSDTANGANPGLAFIEGDMAPRDLGDFAGRALWQLIGRDAARKFARKRGIEFFLHGNGQGLVGAIGAIGYEFADHTLELISYRRRPRFGSRRRLSAESVRRMQERTFPDTFNSFDERKGRILIAPHGPDPVLYGIRGEDARSLVRASGMINTGERPDGYMIFRSNQGTGDHLRHRLDPRDMRPYWSGRISGTVSGTPEVARGGHVFFTVATTGGTVRCAVYRPTGMTGTAAGLIDGDSVVVGGGVRRASKTCARTLNLEFIEVVRLVEKTVPANPHCVKCRKNMKSKGRGQGFECPRCGRKIVKKVTRTEARQVSSGLYIPRASAHRHLTRPLQRMGATNSPKFAGSAWFCTLGN